MNKNSYYKVKYQETLKALDFIFNVIEECKHWKQINGKFISKLKEAGIRCYFEEAFIEGKRFTVKGHVGKNCNEDLIYCRFDGKTWDNLIDRLKEYQKSTIKFLQEVENALEKQDSETKEMKKLIHALGQLQLVNFHYEINETIRNLEKAVIDVNNENYKS
jgi:hypothetical protein